MSHNSRTAVITGASSGLGSIYADRLARRGYDLILIARRLHRLEHLASTLNQKYGVDIQAVEADLAEEADLHKIIKLIAEEKRIIMLVNNAGLAYLKPAEQITRKQVDELIDVNVRALARLSLAVLPHFVDRDEGTLINISSVLSVFPLPGSSVYSGTKAFVTLFTQGLQQEFKNTNVRIQAVLPAATATEIWDVAGVGGHEALDPKTVMTAENCVDAALAGLDAGEAITLTSLNDEALWAQYQADRDAIAAVVNTKRPAARYRVHA